MPNIAAVPKRAKLRRLACAKILACNHNHLPAHSHEYAGDSNHPFDLQSIGIEFTMRHRVRLSAKSIPRFDTACPGRYPPPPPPPSFFQNEEPTRIQFDVTELNWQETDQWRFSLRHAKPWYRIQTLRFVSKIFFRLTLSRE